MTTRNIWLSAFLITLIFAGCTEDNCDFPGASEDLERIDGSWIRVASNNPSADGIVIQLVINQGIITDAAESNFAVGAIKWKDLTSIDKENFMYEELGSDNNYYSSDMRITGDTLRIMVGSSGAGNEQTWVRDGEYTPGQEGPTVTRPLSGSIREDMVLKNGKAAVDYRIEGVLDITSDVVVEPGTVIQMSSNSGIGIYDEGSFKAIGSETSPILITGEVHQKGFWRGIHLETNSSNNVLEFVTIEDAGGNYVYCCNDKATILIKRGGRINLENVVLRNGEGSGLILDRDIQVSNYTNVQIKSHDEYPLQVNPEVLDKLDGTSSSYTGNGMDFALLREGGISESTVVEKLDVPYLVGSNVIDITKTLTIKAGTEIVFKENGGLGVYDDGALSVNGTASEPVIMRGEESMAGYWRGIHMETSKSANSLNYLQMSDAGSNYVYCCNDAASILFKNGQARMRNCTLTNGAGYGIVLRGSFSFSSFLANTISGHAKNPVKLDVSNLSDFDGSDSNLSGNGSNFIEIAGVRRVEETTTINKANIPYLIPEDQVIDITAPLTIRAGARLAFSANSGLGVYDAGELNISGTSSDKVGLYGLQKTPGFWRGIHLEGVAHTIQHAEIQHAASNYVYCCNDKAAVYLRDGTLSLKNSLVADNNGCGVFVRSGAALNESGNSFANNSGGNICD